MCKPENVWKRCVEFHGHECMGLAIGIRQSLAALEALKVIRAVDEELFAVIETDACGVDAVQVLTGCTIGKGNLILKDAGKQALTLANRRTGKAVRVIMKPNVVPESERFSLIRKKIVKGTESEEERTEWDDMQRNKRETLLSLPTEKVLWQKEIEMPIVERARLFKTITCDKCGEPFSEGKAHLSEGRVLCNDCFEDYSRRL